MTSLPTPCLASTQHGDLPASHHPTRGRWKTRLLGILLCGGLACLSSQRLHANGEDSATGTAAPFSAVDLIKTAGSYSLYTGTNTRTVTDLIVPGGVGAFPLAFSRTSTSRYMPGDEGNGHLLGQAGCWRESSHWRIIKGSTIPGSTAGWVVFYPNGAVVSFATVAVNTPDGSTTTPPPDPYLRSMSPGVKDRLEGAGNNQLVLHLSDGSQVDFAKQGNGTALLNWIADPYGIRTQATYWQSGPFMGKLQALTEAAGRWLQFNYKTQGAEVVIDTVTASNNQKVTYGYTTVTTPSGTSYNELISVTYNNEIDPATNAAPVATYTYQPDNTGSNLRPLLWTCNDPHFAGPMPRIRYAFDTTSGAVYGQILQEIDDASSQPNNTVVVSSYNQSQMKETSGVGATGSYAYNSYLQANDTDYEGNSGAYGYDANSYLKSVTNHNGHATSITRDPYAGQQTSVSVTDPANNQLMTTHFDYGSTAQVPYPVNPYWVMKITDSRGQATTYTRYSNNSVQQVSYPDGTYETFGYNAFGQTTSHRQTNGIVYTSWYDAAGNLTLSCDNYNNPSASTGGLCTHYFYDSLDRLSQVTDYNNHNTWYTYNTSHQLTQVKHDDNTHVDYTYDTYGNRTTVSDELQHVTTTVYDNHRRPKSIQQPVNANGISTRTTTFTYENGSDTTGDANTRRAKGTVTLPSGKKLKRVYTAKGYLKSETKGYGTADATTDKYTHDHLGNLLTMVDANNFTQAAYTYDALDRKQTLTDGNNHVTTWTYYPAGNAYAGWLQSVQKPGPVAGGAVVPTNYTSYDTVGRLLQTVDASGHTTGKSYDAYGRLHAVADANGSYTFAYDGLSRRQTLTFPDNSFQRWDYDAVGNCNKYTNRAGAYKVIQYDDRNRPSRYDWSNNLAPARAWGFDAASRCTYVDSWYANLTYTYDDSGLVTSEADANFVSGTTYTNTTGYLRDADGNITTLQYPAGDQAPFTYDNQNRCVGLGNSNFWYSHKDYWGEWVVDRSIINLTVSSQYNFTVNGRVFFDWTHHGDYDPNQSSYPSSNISTRYYGYAPDGQLTWGCRQSDGGASGSALEDNRGENYQYGNDGSLSAFGMLFPSSGQTYDSHQDSNASASNFQGSGGTGSYVNSYAYDSSGNRAQGNTQMGATLNYYPDGEDRYSGMLYDNNSNTTDAATGWTYAYDAEGQMTSAVRQSDNYGITFFYDGLGRLVYQGGSNPTLFCYAGAQRIEERAGASNTSTYRYFFDAPGSDQICFRITSATGVELYYVSDPQGNTTHLMNTNGTVAEQYLYDAYGTPYVYNRYGTYLGNTSGYGNRYLFHGANAYLWLPFPGLYYCRARMYLPYHGRFLQPDPSGFGGGDINLYRYCGNDPVNMVDPTGLYEEDPPAPKLNRGVLAEGPPPIGSNIPSIDWETQGGELYSNRGGGFYDLGNVVARSDNNGSSSSTNNTEPDPPTDKTYTVIIYGYGGFHTVYPKSNSFSQNVASDAANNGEQPVVIGRDQQDGVVNYIQGSYSDGDSLNIIGYSRGGIGALELANTFNNLDVTVNNLITIDPVKFFPGSLVVPPNVVNATNFYETNGGLQGLLPGSFGNFRGTYVSGAWNFQIDTNHGNIPFDVLPAIQTLLQYHHP